MPPAGPRRAEEKELSAPRGGASRAQKHQAAAYFEAKTPSRAQKHQAAVASPGSTGGGSCARFLGPARAGIVGGRAQLVLPPPSGGRPRPVELREEIKRSRTCCGAHGGSGPELVVLGTSAKMKTSHASRKIALCTSSLGIAGTSSSDHVPTTCRGVRISRVVPQLEEGDDVLVEEILSRRRSGRY